jgi:hypothetical protein
MVIDRAVGVDRVHWRQGTIAKVTCPLLDLPIPCLHLGREYTSASGGHRGCSPACRPSTPRSWCWTGRATSGFTVFGPRWLDALAARSGLAWCQRPSVRPASP